MRTLILGSLVMVSTVQAQIPQTPYPPGPYPAPLPSTSQVPYVTPLTNPYTPYPATLPNPVPAQYPVPNPYTPYPATWVQPFPAVPTLPPVRVQSLPIAPETKATQATPLETLVRPVPMVMPPKPATEPMKSRVFEIRDVVCPNFLPNVETRVEEISRKNGDETGARRVALKENAEALMKLIVTVVKPKSWERNGGPGKVQYIAESNSLCLTNTASVLDRVAELLTDLRRTEHQILVETQIVCVRESKDDKSGWPVDKKPLFTKSDAVTKTLRALKDQGRMDILTAPRMMVMDGQSACFCVGEKPTRTGMFHIGAGVGTPVSKDYLKVDCTPVIMLDGKSIAVKMSTVVQKANIERDCKFILAEGETVVLHLGAIDQPKVIAVQALIGNPILSKFHTSGETVKCNYYQIVTTKIVRPADCRVTTNQNGQVFTFSVNWIGGE